MTVSSTTSRWEYNGDGETTVFQYDNIIFAPTDLKVYVDGERRTSGYWVSGAGSGDGGNVNFEVAPAAGTGNVVLFRDVPATQLIKFPEGNPVPSASLTKGLDKATVLIQQLQAEMARKLGLAPDEIDPSIGNLPGAAARASRVLAFDEDGQAVVSTRTLAQLEAAPDAETAAQAAVAAAGQATAARDAAIAAAAGVDLPPVAADGFVVGNAGGTARENQAPAAARGTLDVLSSAEVAAAIAAAIAAISFPSTTPTGAVLEFGGLKAPEGFLFCDGAAVSRTTYADLFAVLCATAEVTITIASPAVVTHAAHGYAEDAPVIFRTAGALPSGISAGTRYYVRNPTANAYNIAATPGGAAIATSGAQNGAHTASYTAHGDGDGWSTFNVPDHRGVAAIGAGIGSGLTRRAPGQRIGAETHTLSTAEMPSHTHSYSYVTGGSSPNTFFGFSPATQMATGGTWGALASSSAGDGGAHNNMPPSVVSPFIVKT